MKGVGHIKVAMNDRDQVSSCCVVLLGIDGYDQISISTAVEEMLENIEELAGFAIIDNWFYNHLLCEGT